MKFKMFLMSLLLTASVLLGGCATTAGVQPVLPDYSDEISIACATISTAQRLITVANNAGKITKAQQETILKADAVILPVCGADKVPTLSSVGFSAFMSAVTIYQGVALKTK